jgi:hypothetical protein
MTPTTTLRNFKSLTKFSYVGLPINMREQLTANRTYYVSTTGNDSNNGLTVGNPFLTIQKAVNTVCGTLDCGGYNVTIQLADGTYTSGVTLFPFIASSGQVFIKGNVTTPGNVIISPSAGHAVQSYTPTPLWNIQSLKLQASAGSGVYAQANAYVVLDSVHFGACLDFHMWATNGGNIEVRGNYSITGGASRHLIVGQGSTIAYATGQTITLTGTPAFTYFAQSVTAGSIFAVGLTFSGAATGARYYASLLSVIQTNSGVNYFPGNSAGSTASGGIYA